MSDAPVPDAAIAELVREADDDAGRVAQHMDAGDPRGEAFIEASVSVHSGVVASSEDLQEVTAWLSVPGQAAGSSALIDTTTIVTVANLLSDAEARLTPLTLWDLSRAVTAIVCYDQLWHFESREVDDRALNERLGSSVFRSLELPSIGPQYDPRGVRGLFNTAWTETHALMGELQRHVGLETAEGREIEDLARQWSVLLGRTLTARDVVDHQESGHRWSSPGGALLEQLWYASRTSSAGIDANVRMLDVTEARFPELAETERDSLRRTIQECNYRAYVNQRLAGQLKLPYVANTSRLPFRDQFYDRPIAVSAALPAVLAADRTYAARAAQADLLRGDPLVLPVFLALALRDAATPADVWQAVARLRDEAARFRERRAELDRELEVGDRDSLQGVRKALGTEAEALSKRLGDSVLAAGDSVLTSIAADPVAVLSTGPLDWVKTGLSATIAGARKLVSAEVARRLVWRLCRPELRFLSDVAMDSRAVIDSLPAVQRLWGLSGGQVESFSRRIDGYR